MIFDLLNNKTGLKIVLITFCVRLISIGFEFGLGISLPHRSDAGSFENSANKINTQLASGDYSAYFSNYMGSTNEMWGLLLSPFWLLPGPSQLYAMVFLSAISALAVYNLYVIGYYYHSSTAGVIAALPVAILPNYVIVHASLLRDGVILFCIVTAIRYLAVPDRSRTRRIAYSALLLFFSLELRNWNRYLFISAASILVIFYLYSKDGKYRSIAILSISVSLLITSISNTIRENIKSEIFSVVGRRSYGARGRTAYLGEPIPDTLAEVISFTPITTSYFLYSPFPWMVETILDLGGFLESLVFIFYTLLSAYGVRYIYYKNRWLIISLLTGFILGVVMWGLGSANVGQAARHRQMFIWIICLFGGVGLTHTIKVHAAK